MNILNLTAAQLKHAADIKEKISALESELQSVLGGGGNGVPSPFIRKSGKRRMSAAGRLAIIRAQKLRWSKVKKSTKPAKKRKMSNAARAKIAAAARARWKKAKAAGKKAL